MSFHYNKSRKVKAVTKQKIRFTAFITIIAFLVTVLFTGCNYFWPDNGGNKVVLAPTVFTAKYNYYTEPIKLGNVIKTNKIDMRYDNSTSMFTAYLNNTQLSLYKKGDKGIISIYISDTKDPYYDKYYNYQGQVLATPDLTKPFLNVELFGEYDKATLASVRSGTFTLIAARKDNVIAIPNVSIKEYHQKMIVGVLENGIHVDKEVTIGLVGDETTEIKSGLAVGEALIFK